MLEAWGATRTHVRPTSVSKRLQHEEQQDGEAGSIEQRLARDHRQDDDAEWRNGAANAPSQEMGNDQDDNQQGRSDQPNLM